MCEEWKDIQGFPGYQISSLGRVRSFYKRGHKPSGYGARWYLSDEPTIIHSSDDGNGYQKVMLYSRQDGKRYCRKVHRLVAEAFIPRVKDADTVDHIVSGAEGKKNNSVDNLRWLSRRKNIQKAYKDGVCDERIRRSYKPVIVTDMRTNEEIYFDSIRDAARYLGVHQSSISHALSGDYVHVRNHIVESAGREDRLLYGRCD